MYADVAFRHIDTAEYYHNEPQVGRAVRESGIPREEIFVSEFALVISRDYAKYAILSATKIYDPDHGYRSTLAHVEESLAKFQFCAYIILTCLFVGVAYLSLGQRTSTSTSPTAPSPVRRGAWTRTVLC